MRALVSVLSFSLLTGLVAFSSGCSTETDDVADQEGALGDPHSTSEHKSIVTLLGGGEISGGTLDTFVSDEDGIQIVHHLGDVKTVASTYAGAPAGEEPALDLLRENLANGIAGPVKDLTALPTYSCEASAYGGPGQIDPDGIYVVAVDSARFDLLTRTIVDAAEATGQDATDLGLRFEKVDAKITYAAFLPAKHTVLFFGRATAKDTHGRNKKVWRIYAADVTTPSCAGGGDATLPHGTINGHAFAPTSGAAFAAEGKTNLIFSTEAETCGMVESKGVAPGATYVQIFALGNEPGTYTSDDAKVATIDASCATGAEPTIGYSTYQVPNRTVVTLTRVDDVVAGTVSAKFEDGSTFEGSFSVPRCTGMGTADPFCK